MTKHKKKNKPRTKRCCLSVALDYRQRRFIAPRTSLEALFMRGKINIAIIGYGRFGRLLAEILSSFGNIFIISRSKLKDKKFKQINYQDLKLMDWIIPAVPISALEKVLKKISPLLKPGSLVMDVSSVKVYPCQWLKKYLPQEVETIGTHPMFGPDSVQNGLTGLLVVICPVRITAKKLRQVKDIFQRLGLKVITTTPDNHDREAAKSLALVHYLGRSLMKMKIKKQTISTLGFNRLLAVNETVNNDTWQLFLDMQNYNPYSKKIRKDFIKSLQIIEKKITKKNRLC